MGGVSIGGGLKVNGQVAWGQIQGSRETQQDAAVCLSWSERSHLVVLADGVGGRIGGDVASGTVVSAFRGSFVNSPDLEPRTRLLVALQAANDALYDRSEAEPALAGMATTLVAVATAGSSLYWVSVGDSPLWLCRAGRLRRLNENHSVGCWVDSLAESGELSAEEAASVPGRGELLEALTGRDIRWLDAPANPLSLRLGDTVIVASDGVETCPGDAMIEILTAGRPSPSDVVEAILDDVEARGRAAQDNATLAVLKPSPTAFDG